MPHRLIYVMQRARLQLGRVADHFGLHRIASRDGFAQEIVHCRHCFRANKNLVGKKRFAYTDKSGVKMNKSSPDEIIPQGRRKRRRDSAHFENFVTRLLQKFANRSKSEKARVGDIENSFPAVVKLAEEQHQAGRKKADVRGSNDNLRSSTRGSEPKLVHEMTRFFQMFDDIEQKNLIELGHVYPNLVTIEVPANEPDVVRCVRFIRDMAVHARDPTTLFH